MDLGVAYDHVQASSEPSWLWDLDQLQIQSLNIIDMRSVKDVKVACILKDTPMLQRLLYFLTW